MVESLSDMHEAMDLISSTTKPNIMVDTCNLSIVSMVKGEDQKFKAILKFLGASRQVGGT